MVLLGDVGHVESRFFPLEALLVLVQDRCMVYARRIIGSEIILDGLDGTPSDEVQVEVIQDTCTVCIEHTIGSKIALGIPDGTLRRCESYGISVLSLWI
jgi:hypothetical protein